ncbi:periplasmic nitrate reductase subunit NapG [Desulfuromonas soudanensis]|uniref:Periplasmic nitrate reductase subunit NapG n=1 Tax=Desulfuromonas soudanensis TaxID=1603606 RepID=A0A0M3QG02_9BACT|nr:MauM/NapG family ferredoxin-type protein [Desulfuromonas soudanensis]ALC17139.1 periplasmic nitrate reductase subunit NapG [Desulfuromonas soudanensis]
MSRTEEKSSLGPGARGALVGGGALWLLLKAGSGYGWLLRPPGAVAEDEFLKKCLRCGRCAHVCPYQAVQMGRLATGVALGTPLIVARQNPCRLCADLPCVRACPSGALDPELKEALKTRMGTAVIVERQECLSLKGLRCEVCYRVCPAIDKAITVESYLNAKTGRHAIFEPVVHKEHCTGCGICEEACVLERPAIVVGPLHPPSESWYEG